jgi:hypothetical protein
VKTLTASASAVTAAGPDRCLEVLRAIEEYPRWYPRNIQSAEILERDGDGAPTRAKVRLYISIGPFERSLPFHVTVSEPAPTEIHYTRIPKSGDDRETFTAIWRVIGSSPGTGPEQTTVEIAFDAELAVPRLVPTGGVGDMLAGSLIKAAIAEIERG